MALLRKAHLYFGLRQHSTTTRANALPAWGQRCAIQRKRAGATLAIQDKEEVQSKPQTPSTAPADKRQQQQQPSQQSPSTPTLWQQVSQRWSQMDWRQRGYALVLGVVVLAVLPQLLALGILLLERVFVGGVLAIEEALVAMLFTGGVALGVLALVGLAAAGVYLFDGRATK